MCRFAHIACLFAISTFLSTIGITADAQEVVTTYYPPQATVTYLPVQRGLFGQRTSYQPVVGLAPATTVTRYAQAPVVAGYPVPFAASTSTTYYTPLTPVTTTYYAPAAVTTYFAPTPVTSYYVSPAYYVTPAPVVVGRVTYYVSP